MLHNYHQDGGIGNLLTTKPSQAVLLAKVLKEISYTPFHRDETMNKLALDWH